MGSRTDSKQHKRVKLTPRPALKPAKERSGAPVKPKREAVSHVAPAPSKRRGKGKEREATPVPSRSTKKTKAKDSPKPEPLHALPSTFKIISGSYEKLLYGIEGTTSTEGSSYSFILKPIFIFPAHISSVRAVAASPHGGKWLATGSGDEIVKVWDLRRRKEIGGLMHHEGSITHLEFPSRSHLLSASEDGSLCLFHARDWSVLRTLKGHKGRVNSVAVHPSGKVALSVGKDRTLRMWDLMRGNGSASTKLGKEAEVVHWSTDGSLFVVLTQSTIDIYSTDMTLLHTITHPSRLHDVKFCKRVVGNGEVLLVAAEDKKLSVYDLPSDRTIVPPVVAEMVGHTNRVKAVETLAIALPSASGSTQSSTTIISTISSDGKIRLYDMAALPESNKEKLQLDPVAEYDTKGSRLTCLAMADGEAVNPAAVNGKRKRTEEGEGDSGGEDEVAGAQDSDSDDEDEHEAEEEAEEEEAEEEEGDDDNEDEGDE
ncbi:WD40 repeat-like protein [Wolfiporia cocos MD-104 SS10]|uniref:WD40 repeat-like protein n=1 Tax=Wolfiporia cocos (strain MD-104) TaxID=742152 RepID=A0A2H3K353_WOLCO|nr:WD40 repeat-like protein [Wolfiporia cocos MD-104 SS10]